MLTICQGDNLATLQRLVTEGQRYDLIELDGPYGAGLEGWDCLDEDAYLAHYTERLTLVRQLLQPWGVVFLFDYPEACAEIKAWTRQSGTLHLRRWVSWYLNQTAHAGRKIQTILVFVPIEADNLWTEFRGWLKQRRETMGLKIVDACRGTGINAEYAAKVGGYLWFENTSSMPPTRNDYTTLKTFFTVPDRFDLVPDLQSFRGLTNRDFIRVPPEQAAHLNDNGLRSKPIGLYLDLFRPTIPPRDTKQALILYGGSGNAAIAAGQFGYDVTVCEQDAARCALIERRWAWHVERRDETPVQDLGPLFQMHTTTTAGGQV